MQQNRVILHVDMDAFFASVEQRDHPEYRGKPLIVGADPKGGRGRGVVSTCSYEARKFGIHSAMPINQAWKRCPRGIYVPPNGALYSRVSKSIFEVFYEFSDMVEPLSVDEAFIDVTGSMRLFGDGPEIARKIKQRILEKEQLTASVGVAPSKFVAKIASDLKKPDGLVVVELDRVAAFLAPLDIARMWGAGAKTQQKLHAMGIRTFGDLARFSADILEKKLGRAGRHFYRLAHGLDVRSVKNERAVKSVSNEHTFDRDTLDDEELKRTLARLCEKVGNRLRRAGLSGRTVHLKLRFDNFETLTRSVTLPRATDSTGRLTAEIMTLFERNRQKGRAVRLLGVGLSGFDRERDTQLSLFDAPVAARPLDKIEDLVKERFGSRAIHRADSIKGKH
ncbi:MAG TPA: DNA polymerase IV [Caldithrix abyssi]|uniref:DNA polymerase IV n=1 Tax=Caldithrix abyssi TaxID=187145 RepID=A0A7V1PU44_CALAY|nr:DNA polymerase IV [Caldithrix abyssi]